MVNELGPIPTIVSGRTTSFLFALVDLLTMQAARFSKLVEYIYIQRDKLVVGMARRMPILELPHPLLLCSAQLVCSVKKIWMMMVT